MGLFVRNNSLMLIYMITCVLGQVHANDATLDMNDAQADAIELSSLNPTPGDFDTAETTSEITPNGATMESHDSQDLEVEDIELEQIEAITADLLNKLQCPIKPPKNAGKHGMIPKFSWILKSAKYPVTSQDIIRMLNLRILMSGVASDVPVSELGSFYRSQWKKACKDTVIMALCQGYLDEVGDRSRLLEAEHIQKYLDEQTSSAVRAILRTISPEELLKYQFTIKSLTSCIRKHLEHSIIWRQLIFPSVTSNMRQADLDDVYKKYLQDKAIPASVSFDLISLKPQEGSHKSFEIAVNELYEDLQKMEDRSLVQLVLNNHGNDLIAVVQHVDSQYLDCLRQDIRAEIDKLATDEAVCAPVIDENAQCTIVIVDKINKASYPDISNPRVYRDVYSILFNENVEKETTMTELSLLTKISRDHMDSSWPGADI